MRHAVRNEMGMTLYPIENDRAAIAVMFWTRGSWKMRGSSMVGGLGEMDDTFQAVRGLSGCISHAFEVQVLKE